MKNLSFILLLTFGLFVTTAVYSVDSSDEITVVTDVDIGEQVSLTINSNLPVEPTMRVATKLLYKKEQANLSAKRFIAKSPKGPDIRIQESEFKTERAGKIIILYANTFSAGGLSFRQSLAT